ncbi:MAG: MG2 domain-containing protein, partial [Bacteroidota bacterium]
MKTKINYTLPLLISVALFAFSLLQATGVINVVTDPKLDTLEQKISAREKDYPEDRIYLTSNEPIYSPGEQIWFSAFVRNGSTLKPSLKSDIVHIELINPAGKVQQTMKLISRDGYCSGDLSIAASLPGGYYKLRAYTNWMLNESDSAGYTKEVLVSKVVLPRLKMNLTYDKDSYTKGEE